MRIGYFIVLAATVLSASCVSLKAPSGYARRAESGRYDFKAISTDGSVISLQSHRNEDREQGTLAYWTEAARKQLTLSRGYELKEEGSFATSKGPGRWMLFSRRYKGTDHLYLLGLVIEGRRIYALEAGGEVEHFQKDLPRVIQAFGTLD